MPRFTNTKQRIFFFLAGLILSTAGQTANAKTVQDLYPLLSDRFIRSARLTTLEKGIILNTDSGIVVSQAHMDKILDQYDPKLQDQLKKNQIFLAEQEILTRILQEAVQKKGMAPGEKVTPEQIGAYFSAMTGDLTVTDNEAKNFYDENREMVGGMTFEQVRDNIKKMLLENKRQTAVRTHINDLGTRHQIRINETWIAAQYGIMTDNPVDKARLSGKATMVEFGATGCIPCDRMQPILEKLKKKFPDTLNIVFLHVRENQVLAGRYGIQSIPVQAFFDADGQEVFRHTGFYAEKEVLNQLKKMGL